MPLFDFECKSCEHQFEALVSEKRKPACPECESRELEKLLTSFAVGSSSLQTPAPGGCGTCGDPRGPGACQLG